ncbi:MAG TPA: chromate transporter [Candidatus Binatia bacterium]|jgi:chromate transporter|nr:chromate transporter [Candidatus Binatia bacterium]
MTTLLQLVLLFASLSLVSFGGGNTVLPEMHREAVTQYGWLTDRQFADVFAISQAAPGPSSLIVALIGLKAAGLMGALVAALSMYGPPAVMTWVASRAWNRSRDAKWRVAVEHGVAPVTVGLIFASGLTIARASDHSAMAWVVTAVATALLVWTKVNPLLIMAVAGLLGWLGFV